MSLPPIVSVNIRNIAVGGSGVGEVVAQHNGGEELLGIAAFVPFTAPGERVAAQVTIQKKRHLEAELREIETPAKERVTPLCEYFTICGGCELQHLSYAGQLEAKAKMIDGTLRTAKLPSDALAAVQPVVGGAPFSYRHRLTLHIDQGGKVGLYRANSRSVVAINSCSISNDALNAALSDIQSFGREVQGKVSSLLLEADEQGVIAILKSPYDLAENDKQAVLSYAKSRFGNVKLLVSEKEIGGVGRQILELPLNELKSLMLQVPAGTFSQVNIAVNQKLISKVVEEAQVGSATKVLDLYAGAGNFSLPLARRGATVLAVECDPRLVSFGRENAQRYGLEKKLQYFHGSVEKYLSSEQSSGQRGEVDCLVADPPRNGLGNLVGDLPSAKRLLYISCHLPSFVRDLKALLERGFHAKVIQPFDMFAQTSYVEILSVLEKGK